MKKNKTTTQVIINDICEKTGLNKRVVKKIINSLLSITITEVSNGGKVVFRGFGTFSIKPRKARRIRDINSGEITLITPPPIPSFKASSVLLDEIKTISTKGAKKITRTESPEQKIVPKQKPSAKPLVVLDVEGCKVIESIPNPRQTASLKIGFIPSHEYDSDNNYPIICTPRQDSFIKLPRKGRSDIRGYKEECFLSALRNADIGVSISDDMHLAVSGRSLPYEPDIVLYDEERNLYIDVEIDEPYDGYSRLVTHTTEGNDTIRNLYYKESGWIVVRFSERQIHLQCESCIETLKTLISTLLYGNEPKALSIEKESRWNKAQAIDWEKALYREKYLGIQSFAKQIRNIKVLCEKNTQTDSIEHYIHRSYIHQEVPNNLIGLSSTISPRTSSKEQKPLSETHPLDLSFDEDTHSYYAPTDLTGNSDHMSVTTLIEQFFPYFDQEEYIKKKMEESGRREEDIRKELNEPSERGTDMHKQIELFLKGEPHDESSKEFQLFLTFYNDKILTKGLVFDSAEFAIKLKGSNIAGTVDALFRKADGSYVMIDWKRSTHLIIDGYPKMYGFGRGLSILSHLDNSSYYKYELQQSFYKYILEKDYGIKISSMILAVLHPKYDQYYTIKLSTYREKEVKEMIYTYESLK